MKAIVQDRYGSPDVLQLRNLDPPRLEEGSVRVKVHAASVNAADWHLMRGKPFLTRLFAGLRRPRVRVRGIDVAGTVESVGPRVTRWKPGDAVFGTARGSFAELSVAKEGDLVEKPSRVTFEEAAAVPIAAFTALEALRDHARVRAGEAVLVIGAGGGVGHFVVQIAKGLGARVTAATRTENLELVRSLGADATIDYSRDDVAPRGAQYDVIVDLGGSRPLREYRRALTPTGTYVLVGSPRGGSFALVMGLLKLRLLSRSKGQRLAFFVAKGSAADLVRLKELLESGALIPRIDRRYPLDAAPEAVRYLESGQARGKVVIQVA